MCGIAGFIDFNKNTQKETLLRMTNVLKHRGKDDQGFSFEKNQYANIGLGHRRLSILDLSDKGHQPYSYDNLELVYNGEVYNFKQIKSELIKTGYTFESHSDTEVIIKAYHKWGVESLKKFNGMFSIVIYDKSLNKLFCIRDRSGVKPFYYYWKDDIFLFSSELKSFHLHTSFKKEIDKSSLDLYLQYGYILEPFTIFKDTKKLKAGFYLELDIKSGILQEYKFWDIISFYDKPKLNLSESEVLDKLEKLLFNSFEDRMLSDVPVGVFLSGGYDSSLVTALLSQKVKNLNTFTIGFKEEKYNEAPYAKDIAKYLKTNHTEYFCTQKDALDIIPSLCEIYDEPFGDKSVIPTVLISRLVKDDISVALSADGGDELLFGYQKYTLALKLYNKFNFFPKYLKVELSKIMNNINPNKLSYFHSSYNFNTRYYKIQNILQSENIIDVMSLISEYFTEQERNNILNNFDKYITNFDKNIFSIDSDIDKMLAIDYKTYLLDGILTKVDRATMSAGIEAREPLLDFRVVEFLAQLSPDLKYKNKQNKWLFKQLTYRYLPKKLLNRPKKGFSVPLDEWFNDELKNLLFKYLNQERINKEGIFNSNEIAKLRDDYFNGKRDNIHKLWLILIFEIWYEKWM